MLRLLRNGCFFINHHHYRIGLPTIHFSHPDLTQFCLYCELCLLRCFGYLGTVLPTPTLCIVLHLTLHFRIASQNPSLHFRNPIELPQPPPHSRYHHLTFEILSSRFPFPKVFRLLRHESPSSWYLHQDHRHSSSTRMITSISSWYRGIPPLYIPLAIALITSSPFCVTCLSRLDFEYCRQCYLCTLVIYTIHCIHTISYWYHIILCASSLFPHIYNCYLGLCISQSGHRKKEKKE